VTEQKTAAAEEIKELNERFSALIDKIKASQEMNDEERAVRLLAWKLEWDMMMREREASIVHHGAAKLAHESVVEQARVMIATRHEDAGELSLHRERLESTYREGFKDITNALKALTTPTILNDSGPGTCPHGKSGNETCDDCSFTWRDAPIGAGRCTSLRVTTQVKRAGALTRCTRHGGHAGSHCADELEWSRPPGFASETTTDRNDTSSFVALGRAVAVGK